MFKSEKLVSIDKMKRISKKEDTTVILTMSNHESIDGVTIHVRNALEATLIRGVFLYETYIDKSQRDAPQKRCRRLEFNTESDAERWLNGASRKRKRFTLDDVLMGGDKCTFSHKFDVGLTRTFKK